MEKTFTFNTKIAESILENYEDFLSLQNNQNNSDEYVVRLLELLQELNIEKFSMVLEKAFEATLKKEEGIHHNFSLVISPPESRFGDLLSPYNDKHNHGSFEDVCSFEIPVDIELLPKIAPAFESTNKKLRIWFNDENKIEIWGFASHFFDYLGLEIKSFSPGQLLIHVKAQDFPHARHLVTFAESKRVVSKGVNLSGLLDSIFDETNEESIKSWENCDSETIRKLNHRRQRRFWFLVDIINKIMNHKHGGTLLFIPQKDWEEVLSESVNSISYKPKRGYDYVESKFIKEENEIAYSNKTGQSNPSLPWSFAKEADFIAQITAVDGATILNKDFRVLGFGAKIKVKQKSNDKNKELKLEKVWIKEPFENFKEYDETLSKSGGMRHQSTAQFIFDQREKNIFAIVTSEDGKVSIMYWDKVRKIVTIQRHIEYLFYDMNI